MYRWKAGLVALLLLCGTSAQALLESFNSGKFAVAANGSTDWHASAARAVMPLSGGGYLVIGNDEVQDAVTGRFKAGTTLYALRLTAGLVRDTTFGSNGVLPLSLPAGYRYRLPHVYPLADGKFLVAAETADVETGVDDKILLARFNADATPDTTFATAGSLLLAMPEAYYSADIPQLVVQADGRIVLTGTTLSANGREGFVTRFSVNGVQETTFGNSGFLLLQPLARGTWVTHAVLDSAGCLIVAGEVDADETGNVYDLFAARVTLGGTPALDTTWNAGDYYRIMNAIAGNSWATALVRDGTRILLASRVEGSEVGAQLTRFLTTGALDTTFAATGTLSVTADIYTDSYVFEVVPAATGYYLLGALNNHRAVVKLTEAGALDTVDSGFSGTGFWRSDISNASVFMYGKTDNGQLLAVGFSVNERGGSTEPAGYSLENTAYVVSRFPLAGTTTTTVSTSSSSSSGGSMAPVSLLIVAGLLLWRRARRLRG